MIISSSQHVCPCGSEQEFSECCGRYINQGQPPASPEQLMRSRYSAYVMKNEKYLLDSWHLSTHPANLDLSSDTTRWKKLKIITSSDNTVQFVAFFSETINAKETDFYLGENSEFIKEVNWYYLKGNELKTSKLSKNMACPCQSGKKFKRCCATTF